MNDVQYLIDRQLGIGGQYNYDNILRRLIVRSDECYYGLQSGFVDPGFEQDPPIFACKFAQTSGYEHILALANEDGRVALQDTSKVGGVLEGFQCHNNAVFDLVWLPGELKFLTVSGDHTAALWDCGDGAPRRVRVLAAHTRSVRTAAVCRAPHAQLLATGARDGLVLLWDPRAAAPAERLAGCHAARAATPPRRPARAPRPASVTALAFRAPHELLSAGEGDPSVKLWDLRRSYSAARAPLPARALPPPGAGARVGYTHLLLDAGGARLYAGCVDGGIYAYSLAAGGAPLRRYAGHEVGTFYIRAALSPDDRYLVSGSSDRHAYVWNVARSAPLLRLAGHRAEVTCAAWRGDARAPPALLVTCGDDARHKLWRVGPEAPPPDHELRGSAQRAPPAPAPSPRAPPRTPHSANRPRPRARAQRCLLQLLTSPAGTAAPAAPAPARAPASAPAGHTTPPSKRRASSEERGEDLKRRCTEESWGALADAGGASPGRARTPERRSPPPEPRTPGTPPARGSPRPVARSPVTSRLPDFVRDGEAPHLRLMSPLRRRPDPDDWLTRLARERWPAPEPPAGPPAPSTPTRRLSATERTLQSSERARPAERPPRAGRPARTARTLLKYFTVTTKTDK